MDPLSAIGLVSSVITFIDFGYEVISAAREVRSSATGTTAANNHIEFLNTRMKAVATDLAAAKSSQGSIPADTRRLTELADKCLELSNDLKKLLDKLRANNPKSKRQVFSVIVQNVRKKDQKRDLEARLDQCRQLLHLQLSHTTRLESLSRLDEISQTGKCYERELGSLNHQVVALRHAVAGLNPHSKLQAEARTVLDLSDLAVSKVLQNSILEALRFEKMESRFDSIEEAHTETFKWLLEDETSSSITIPTVNTDDPWFTGIVDHLKEDIPLRLEIRKDFTNWLSRGDGIFHVSGKPGAGKSTLMKYLAESDQVRKYLNTWKGDRELVFASFFFWRHGTDFQKSLQGLLRSLLYSVLDQHPNLTRMVFPAQWEAATISPGRAIRFRQTDIREAFVALTETTEVNLRHKFAFFIDGLDEFEGHDDKLVKTLFDWAYSDSENIKICVSSRELPIFQQRFSKCPKFRLHEVTRRDIFLFVYDTLRTNEDVKLMSRPQDMAGLGISLVRRAEGVFLWVSLALRLVERGLVLEESIEDLQVSISVLPSELEQMFRVIFYSIKTERDIVKRRKAMRTLSLALDELQVPQCAGNLFLTHLSFMDDYDRDPEFASHTRDQINATDRSIRLSRCRKQLNGGCKGLLTIRSSPDRPELRLRKMVRKEIVALAHRSLIEFFQIPEIRQCVEKHSQGFDKLHFYGQSLIAELEVWPICQEYEESHPSPHTLQTSSDIQEAPPRPTNSVRLHDEHWLVGDLRRLISFSYYCQDLDTSSLLPSLYQLGQLLTAEGELLWQFDTEFCHMWEFSSQNGSRHIFSVSSFDTSVRCHPDVCIALLALEHGLYEFSTTKIVDNTIRELALYVVERSLERDWLRTDKSGPVDLSSMPFDRLLRSLATCLADGISANSIMPFDSDGAIFSIWQHLVWKTIVFRPEASPALVWLLFLLHGADRSFTLSFQKTCNFSGLDKSSKLVLVTGLWGPDKHQVHSPMSCPEGHGGILELGKSQTWSLSLKELTYLWFAPHADKFRKVYELYEKDADVTRECVKDLRRELGFDPEFWQTQVCDDRLDLFKYECEGRGWVLELWGSDGSDGDSDGDSDDDSDGD